MAVLAFAGVAAQPARADNAADDAARELHLAPATIPAPHPLPLPAAAMAEPVGAVVFGRALDLEGAPLRLASVRAAGLRAGAGQSYRGPSALPRGLPLRRAAISSSYGMREHPLLGTLRFHAGLDFPAPTGTPVHATAPGLVTFAGWCGGYGLCITIDHGGGMSTLFGHLSSTAIQAGDLVASGASLGRVGSTGISTGPHLHYEVRRNGNPLDPRRFF